MHKSRRIAFFGDSLTAGRPGCAYLDRLRTLLPDDVLLNFGRGNETAGSLLRRMAAMRADAAFDLAVVWIGINDVQARRTPSFRLVSWLQRRSPAPSCAAFEMHYRAVLEQAAQRAPRVLAVTPFLKGEGADERCDAEVDALCAAVARVTANQPGARLLDIRTPARIEVAAWGGSPYLPSNIASVCLLLPLSHRDHALDRVARMRGLRYTVDGIHLNSQGAQLVAEALRDAISASFDD